MDPTRRVYFIEGTYDFGCLTGITVVGPNRKNAVHMAAGPSFPKRVWARKTLRAWHKHYMVNYRRRRA